MTEDIRDYNRRAWNHQVDVGNRWSVPVDGEVIAAAKRGEWSVLLTPMLPVPRAWFPESMKGLKVLGLASAGGQQCAIFAAAGAEVTVFDNAPKQLAQDAAVAVREGLQIHTVEGDMRDLSVFADERFDLVFHPVSNCFVPDVRPVWREAARVLRPGGALLSGFINPLFFIFDDLALERSEYVVRYRVPFDDREQLDPGRLEALIADQEPICFGHTLDDLIGGQLDAGLTVTGFFEDRWGGRPIDDRIANFIATRAVKPSHP